MFHAARKDLLWDLTAPFNNMRTLKFKAQPTNAFFATVNQIFGGSSQLPTMLSELCSTIWFDYRLNCAQRFDFITARSAVVGPVIVDEGTAQVNYHA